MLDKGDKLSCNTCLDMFLPNNRIFITSGFSTCYKQVITYHVWFFHVYIMLYTFAYGFTNQVYKYHFRLFHVFLMQYMLSIGFSIHMNTYNAWFFRMLQTSKYLTRLVFPQDILTYQMAFATCHPLLRNQ